MTRKWRVGEIFKIYDPKGEGIPKTSFLIKNIGPTGICEGNVLRENNEESLTFIPGPPQKFWTPVYSRIKTKKVFRHPPFSRFKDI